MFNNYIMPPRYGQTNRHYNLGKYLVELGHEPVVFAGSHPHNTDVQLIEGAEPFCVDPEQPFPWVWVKTIKYRNNRKKQVYSMFEYFFRGKKAAKMAAGKWGRPDVILGSSAHPLAALLAIRLGKKYGCKAVVEVRDLWPESIVAYGIAGAHNPAVLALRRLEKYLYRRCDALIFTMEGAYDYIVEQGWEKDVPRSKVHFINNGVDLEAFDYNRAHFPVDDPDLDNPDIFKAVYTGSIRKVNNLGLLLDAAKEIKDPRVKFLIWGGGDELEALQKRAAGEKISNVVFKGLVEKQYIPSIVSQADVNILHGNKTPMLRFGISPNKLFDYFAAEKPVISDLGKKNDLVEQYGAGITVNTTEELPTAIEQLLEMPDEMRLKMCSKVAEAAKAYDFKVLTQHFLQIIESV